jgi:DNA-binding SARP family transcriptional activator
MVPTTDAHPPRIRIGLLGAVVAEIDGTAADLGGPRQRAVFAVLALTPNRMIATAQLVDAVWGDAPPLSAKSTLQAYISRLRRVIEPSGAATIEHSAAGYALRVDPVSVDLERFAESVRDGRRALATGVFDLAADRLGEALGHWQGEPLADLQGYAFADAERVRLRNERHAVIADRIDAELAAGRHESVVAELEALVLAAPLHEPFWIRLMIALYRCDRQADALAAYQSARAALLEQLGIDPGPALAATEAAILRQDPALGVEAAAIGGAAEPRARGTGARRARRTRGSARSSGWTGRRVGSGRHRQDRSAGGVCRPSPVEGDSRVLGAGLGGGGRAGVLALDRGVASVGRRDRP